MKLRTVLALSLVALMSNGVSRAQDNPKPPAQLGLFGQGATQAEPTIEAALLLTDQQVEQLKTARAETVDSAALKELRKKSADKALAEEERKATADKYKEATATARAEWKKRSTAILTDKQKELVDMLNKATNLFIKDFNSQYAEKLKAAEGDAKKALTVERDEKARQAIRDRFQQILTEEQQAAVAKAKGQ